MYEKISHFDLQSTTQLFIPLCLVQQKDCLRLPRQVKVTSQVFSHTCVLSCLEMLKDSPDLTFSHFYLSCGNYKNEVKHPQNGIRCPIWYHVTSGTILTAGDGWQNREKGQYLFFHKNNANNLNKARTLPSLFVSHHVTLGH